MDRMTLNGMLHDSLDEGTDDMAATCAAVVAAIPDDDLRDALALTLPEYARVFVGLNRIRLLAPTSPTAEIAEERTVLPEVPDDPPKPGPSRRQRAYDAWQHKLKAMVSVGTGRLKPLGQCTVEEIEMQTTKLVDQMRALGLRHDLYAAIAKAMREHDAERVADLPEDVLCAILGGGAS